MLDEGTRNVDPGRFLQTEEARSRVDLEHDRAGSVDHEVDPALAETERGSSGDGEIDLPRLRVIRYGRASTRRVGTPFPVACAEPGRRDNRTSCDQEPVARLATWNPTLHHHFVSHPPQAVEHPFEMGSRFTLNNTHPHPRTPLFHDNGITEEVVRRRGQGFRVRTSHRRDNRQTCSSQGSHRRPMVPTDADGVRRVWRCSTSADDGLEHRQEAFRSPVADSRNDHVRRQRGASAIQELNPVISEDSGRPRGVDDPEINAEGGRRLDKPLVGAQVRAGSQENDNHRAMVTHSCMAGILVE